MKRLFRTTMVCAAALGATSTISIGEVSAQGAVSELVNEITVVARKREEAAQSVPVAVTAFNSVTLDALHVRDLQSLSFTVPNVQLEDIGTAPGVANFSIRGLGVNSSIPSIDPTVGVFIDGVYLGINAGVVFDVFDLEGIEILRGPQGLLFGRNVTGGAVLVKTKKPGDEFEAHFKGAIEKGLQYTVAGSVSGPIVEGVLSAKIAAYYKKDEGYFTNLFNGNNDFGEEETVLFRPVITLKPADNVELTVRYEHGDIESDGPASQNGGLFSRNSFLFAIDEEGFSDSKWDQVIAEVNIDVGFGDGTITNIFAWRDYEQEGRSDIDATTSFLFHAGLKIRQDQLSNEFRYTGRFFDRLNLTAGLYWFTQDINYFERRELLGGIIDSTLGGRQDQTTMGAFAQGDFELMPNLILNLGARYTYEKKAVDIATFIPIPGMSACDFAGETCVFDFTDDENWNNVTPKVGLQWFPTEDIQLYGFWTKGFRSGGYNFRNTSPTASPGPFDEEDQSSFEIGAKTEWMDGRVRFNIAGFYNDISDLQREVNLPDPIVGVVQVIKNTADATIKGFEIDGQAQVMDNLLLTVTVGYVDGEYDKVIFDISGDGLINDVDKALDLPRLAPWTYGAGFVHDMDLGEIGILTTRFNYYHRDQAAYTDNNLGFLNKSDMIDASMALSMHEGQVTLSAFGKNLLNEVTHGNDTQLPFFPGATFSPLNKGRIWGVELNLRY